MWHLQSSVPAEDTVSTQEIHANALEAHLSKTTELQPETGPQIEKKRHSDLRPISLSNITERVQSIALPTLPAAPMPKISIRRSLGRRSMVVLWLSSAVVARLLQANL